MEICGLQKLSLLDYPGKLCCTVFTFGCNFRCPFCHNADLVLGENKPEKIETGEVLSFLKKRASTLEGVCVSGGEPLLQKDLFDFLSEIKTLGYQVKLDTNGSFPEKLKECIEKKLVDYVAMDIKNSPEKYAKTAGLDICNVEDIIKSAEILMKSGLDYEFRTTVVRELHDTENFLAIGQWLRGAKAYYLQSFEDSGKLLSQGLHARSAEEMEAYAGILKAYIPNVLVRN